MPENQQQATSAVPPYSGRPLVLAGTEYIVPPLTLGSIRRLSPVIDRLGATETRPFADQIDDVVAIVHGALVRNYPKLTPDAVADLIELTSIDTTVKTVLEAAGLVKAPDAGDTEGNGAAGQR